MGNTIYASFNDSELAEKAAGALLDFGVRADDISVVQSHRRFSDSRPLNADLPMNDTSIAEHGVAEPWIAHPSIADPSNAEYGVANRTAPSNDDHIEIYSTEPPLLPSGEPIAPMEAPATSVGTSPSEAAIGTTPHATYTEDADDHSESHAKYGITTTTGADAEAGAVKGAAWGVGVGVLAALASLAIPGFGFIVGGGALAMALAGVAGSAGAGAIAGGVTGYLKDQGVDEHVAKEYVGTVDAGGGLVAVTVPSGDVTELEARMILEKYGAANINAYSAKGYLA